MEDIKQFFKSIKIPNNPYANMTDGVWAWKNTSSDERMRFANLFMGIDTDKSFSELNEITKRNIGVYFIYQYLMLIEN